jgi:hypothetical protein
MNIRWEHGGIQFPRDMDLRIEGDLHAWVNQQERGIWRAHFATLVPNYQGLAAQEFPTKEEAMRYAEVIVRVSS